MKLKLLIFSLAGLFLIGCSSHPSAVYPLQLIGQIVTNWDAPFSAIQEWKISPESTVRTFVESLATSECERAKECSTGDAKREVQAIIDAGCDPYESSIMSISCEMQEKTCRCTCAEKKYGLNTLYYYDLVLVKKKWKIEYFEKDYKQTN